MNSESTSLVKGVLATGLSAAYIEDHVNSRRKQRYKIRTLEDGDVEVSDRSAVSPST